MLVETGGKISCLSGQKAWRNCGQRAWLATHYTLDPENSERVMLKYFEHLWKIRSFLETSHDMKVLENLEKFPLDTDDQMREYYEKITEKVNRHRPSSSGRVHRDRFYIYKIKPFLVFKRVYYEVTVMPATGKASKFDRIIAFTTLDIPKYYSVKLDIKEDYISVHDNTMPIFIIVNWETSIRPCEIRRFSNVFGENLLNQGRTAEYRGLMRFLTQTGFNLVEFINLDDLDYSDARSKILSHHNAKTSPILELLDRAREIIKCNRPGCNVLRYLLYHLNNQIIMEQVDKSNRELSGLCLAYGCIPFDKMPFNTSLLRHNPRLGDLFDCIPSHERKHEILARLIRNNTEQLGQLYTRIADLDGFEDIDALIATYNNKLYHNERHQGRRIEQRKSHLYIRHYEEDTIAIIRKLTELSNTGIQNYSSYVNAWLESNIYTVNCDQKRTALRAMFEESKVALIYGSAGTGKTTLTKHISHLFSKEDKLFLAHTNPAVENLRSKVDSSNCEFMTITKFIKGGSVTASYDLLIIDECSTVSNQHMRDVLDKAEFELLILVGDVYQIEAIRFGNWFTVARGFFPSESVCELTTPYRSTNKQLLTLWDRVRNMDDRVMELMARQGYSVSPDASIFDQPEDDEIVLCLNYDGLYGINNINRFLQQSNKNSAIQWGLHVYKIGDPVLFNESERFSPLIYNNMKGWIVGIKMFDGQIQFDIELDKVINGLEARDYDFELLPNSPRGGSVIRFFVDKYKSVEEDDDASTSAIVPFQVSYAVSIHKSQGLEYDSVKIVITDEVEDLVTHNIFYTAITRARKNLKIYWTPEVANRVLSRIKPRDIERDITLLKQAIYSG